MNACIIVCVYTIIQAFLSDKKLENMPRLRPYTVRDVAETHI